MKSIIENTIKEKFFNLDEFKKLLGKANNIC